MPDDLGDARSVLTLLGEPGWFIAFASTLSEVEVPLAEMPARLRASASSRSFSFRAARFNFASACRLLLATRSLWHDCQVSLPVSPLTHHAVDTLGCLCKDEFVYAALAGATGEAVGVIGLVASHDRLLRDCLFAHKALGLISGASLPNSPDRSSSRTPGYHQIAEAGSCRPRPCPCILHSESSRHATAIA